MVSHTGGIDPKFKIASQIKECVDAFSALEELFSNQALKASHQISLLEINDTFALFKVWGGHIGGFDAGDLPGSLDQRLQKAEGTKKQLLSLLGDLGKTLKDSKLYAILIL